MTGETLEYEQSSGPRCWRRRVLRWTWRLVVPGLVLGLAAAGWWQRAWISDWVGWQLAMRTAWLHEMPPEGSSILANGEKGAALAKASEDYALDADGIATYHPAVLPRLADYDWRFDWPNDVLRVDPPPIVFMGVLRRPDGEERLVIVTGGMCNSLRLLSGASALVVGPPSLLGGERFTNRTQMGRNESGRLEFGVLHMGRRDTKHANRVLIPFTAYGHGLDQLVGSGTVVLELGDDDILHASLADVQIDDRWGPIGLGPDELSSPRFVSAGLRISPWRVNWAPPVVMRQRASPSTRPIDW